MYYFVTFPRAKVSPREPKILYETLLKTSGLFLGMCPSTRKLTNLSANKTCVHMCVCMVSHANNNSLMMVLDHTPHLYLTGHDLSLLHPCPATGKLRNLSPQVCLKLSHLLNAAPYPILQRPTGIMFNNN